MRLKNIRPDFIFHTATYGGSAEQKNTEKIIETNITGTVNLYYVVAGISMLDLLVNTGSSSEYGIKNLGNERIFSS